MRALRFAVPALLLFASLAAVNAAAAPSPCDLPSWCYVCVPAPGSCRSVACIYLDGEDKCTEEMWSCRGVGDYWVCPPPGTELPVLK